MTVLRASLIAVALLAGVAMLGYKNCGCPASSTSTSASSSASASTSASSSSSGEAAEAAKLTTKAVDQAPTTLRDRSKTTFYRPDGSLDHVTIRDREVRFGRRREALEAVEASASASTASSSSSTSSSSSSSSTRSSSTTSAPATWAILWGGELAPEQKPLGLVGLERRLIGPLWASAWATPAPLELGLGARLQLGNLSLLYAPRLLPVPQLAGVAGVGFHLGGPFDVEAWGSLSSLQLGGGLLLAW